MATVLHRVGQSIYDICLQTYGSLTYLVKLCQDNGVTDMQDIPQQVEYYYDETLVQYQGNDKIFSTAYVAPAAPPPLYPVLPQPTDLVGAYWSTYGVSVDVDGNVANWQDVSAYGNHLPQATAGNRPGFDSSLFDGKGAVKMQQYKWLQTIDNFNGLAGETGMTMLLVCIPRIVDVVLVQPDINYGDGDVGDFFFKQDYDIAAFMSFVNHGATDDNKAKMPFTTATSYVFAAYNEFAAGSPNINVYKNGDDFGVITTEDATTGTYAARVLSVGGAPMNIAGLFLFKGKRPVEEILENSDFLTTYFGS